MVVTAPRDASVLRLIAREGVPVPGAGRSPRAVPRAAFAASTAAPVNSLRVEAAER